MYGERQLRRNWAVWSGRLTSPSPRCEPTDGVPGETTAQGKSAGSLLEHSLSLGGASLFVQVRFSADGVRPIHMVKGHQLTQSLPIYMFISELTPIINHHKFTLRQLATHRHLLKPLLLNVQIKTTAADCLTWHSNTVHAWEHGSISRACCTQNM